MEIYIYMYIYMYIYICIHIIHSILGIFIYIYIHITDLGEKTAVRERGCKRTWLQAAKSAGGKPTPIVDASEP